MALKLIDGPIYLAGGRDKEGYRNWSVKHTILSDTSIGPALTLLTCPGLPQPGQMWLFNDDVDPWAYCGLEAKVTPLGQHGKSTKYSIEQSFSSAPNFKWCKDQQIDDPLLQPPKISGNFNRYSEEATFDRFGNFLQNSSHEQLRGPVVEFDADRIQIEIEQNVLNLDLPLLTTLSNTVNAFPLWGAAPRIIKFNPGAWSMNFYGQCHRYFTRKLMFEAKKDGWDRVTLDEGTKVLNGQWNTTGERKWVLKRINGNLPDPRNPAHFIRYKDPRDENTKAILDGMGKPFIPQNVTLITGCTRFPKSPSKWFISGIVNEDDQSTVVLEYGGGSSCTWSGTWKHPDMSNRTVLLTLEQLPDQTYEWRIGITGYDDRWFIDAVQWKKFGPNVLVNQSVDLDVAPTKLGLSCANVPGVRAIQKYEGADLLLLGIPANL